MNSDINFIYFGGEPLGVPVLEELKSFDLVPSLIVCSPDKPVGRKQILTPPPVKVWAEKNGVEIYQPESYKDAEVQTKFKSLQCDVFVVVAYNYILPQWLIDIPQKGVVNVHPSMLPKLRGASPIRTAIMNDERENIGVSIMMLDAKMDHGPILAQMPLPIVDDLWPIPGPDLDEALARMGGAMLADTLRRFLSGDITPTEQNHEAATYCGRLSKVDSEMNIDPYNLPEDEAAQQAWNKINAFIGMGDTWFTHNDKRIKIKEAQFLNGKLRLLIIVPEGKGPIPFDQWLDNLG